jgi:hypothetical protein
MLFYAGVGIKLRVETQEAFYLKGTSRNVAFLKYFPPGCGAAGGLATSNP